MSGDHEELRLVGTYKRRAPRAALALALGPMLALSCLTLALCVFVLFAPEAQAEAVWRSLPTVAALPALWLLLGQPFATIGAGILYFGVPRAVEVRALKASLQLSFANGERTRLRASALKGGLVVPAYPGTSKLLLSVGEGLRWRELELRLDGDVASRLARRYLGKRREAALAGPSLLRALLKLGLGVALGGLGALLLVPSLASRGGELTRTSPDLDLGAEWLLGAATACLGVGVWAASRLLRPGQLRVGLDGILRGRELVPWAQLESVARSGNSLRVTLMSAGTLRVFALGAARPRLEAFRDEIAEGLSALAQREAIPLPKYSGSFAAWRSALLETQRASGYRTATSASTEPRRLLLGEGVDDEARLAAAILLSAVEPRRARALLVEAARGAIRPRLKTALLALARRKHPGPAVEDALRE